MKRNLKKRLGIWAVVVAIILIIPFVGTHVSAEWDWSLSDFVLAAVMLFGTAVLFEVLTNKMTTKNRYAIGTTMFFALVFIWVILATS